EPLPDKGRGRSPAHGDRRSGRSGSPAALGPRAPRHRGRPSGGHQDDAGGACAIADARELSRAHTSAQLAPHRGLMGWLLGVTKLTCNVTTPLARLKDMTVNAPREQRP